MSQVCGRAKWIIDEVNEFYGGKIDQRPWCSPPKLEVPVHVPLKIANFEIKRDTKDPVDVPFLVD